MARISKFENTFSETSKEYGEDFKKEALKLTLEDIESLQVKYGISDAEMSKILEINRMVISHWKTQKRELPKYYLFNIYSFFQYLEKRYDI
jgi:DNA-binding transcriptional regulator YiaG